MAAEALDEFSRRRHAKLVKEVRTKILKVSQVEASRLFGGGHNAFTRYESGEIAVSQPLLILLQLLEKDPSLAETIKGIRA